MDQNPYETPKLYQPSHEEEHRSFRLTPGSGQQFFDDLAAVPDLSKAVAVALVQQLPLLGISALLLDGGRVFDAVLKAALLFWLGFVLAAMVVRNKQRGSNGTLCRYLRLAFLPIAIVMLLVAVG